MEENRIDVYEENNVDQTCDYEPECEVSEVAEAESSSNVGSSLIAGAIGGALVIGGIKLFGKIKATRAAKKAAKEASMPNNEAGDESEEA